MAGIGPGSTKSGLTLVVVLGVLAVAVVALLSVNMNRVGAVASSPGSQSVPTPNASATPSSATNPPFSILPPPTAPTYAPLVQIGTVTGPHLPACNPEQFQWTLSSDGYFTVSFGQIDTDYPLVLTLTSGGRLRWQWRQPPGVMVGGYLGESGPAIPGLTTSNATLVMTSGPYGCVIQPDK